MSDAPIMITVKYSCHGCGLEKVGCQVAERGKGQDIKEWIEAVAQAVANDHAARCPWCTSDKCDLMIPVSGVEQIGGAPRQ